MSEIQNINENSQYDAILFAAEFSPNNEFSMQFENSKVNFEDLSTPCLIYFLNRFKNFDLTPSRLVASKNSSYKIELNLSSIYDNFTTKLKTERPINRCTKLTLGVLTCLELLTTVLVEIEYNLVVSDGSLDLCGITSEFLTVIVEKMRQFQLRPNKIFFSSETKFHIIFNTDEILRLAEYGYNYVKAITIGLGSVATIKCDSLPHNSNLSMIEYPVSTGSNESNIENVINSCNETIRVKRKYVKRNKGFSVKSVSCGLDDILKEVAPNATQKKVKQCSDSRVKTPRSIRPRDANNVDTYFPRLSSAKLKMRNEKSLKKVTLDDSETKSTLKCNKRVYRALSKKLPSMVSFYGVENTTDIDAVPIITSTDESILKIKSMDNSINSILKLDSNQYSFENIMKTPMLTILVKEEATESPRKSNNNRLIFPGNTSPGIISNSLKHSTDTK